MPPEGALRLVVDSTTGEVIEEKCPHCRQAASDLENAERDLVKARRQIRQLQQDRERDAKIHPRREQIVELFDFWRTLCKHPRARLDADRAFLVAGGLDQALAYLKDNPDLDMDPMTLCKRAIVGLNFDPYVTKRKNGTAKRHDGLHLALSTAARFEEAVNKAPRNWRELVGVSEALIPVEAPDAVPLPEDDRMRLDVGV